MTIIFTNVDFHIEFFELPLQAVGAGGEYNQLATLDKAGRFIGASAYLAGVSSDNDVSGVRILNQSTALLTYGQAITGVRVLARSVNAQNLTYHVMIWIRN